MAVTWAKLYENEGILETAAVVAGYRNVLPDAVADLVLGAEAHAKEYLEYSAGSNGEHGVANRNLGRVAALRAMGVLPEQPEQLS